MSVLLHTPFKNRLSNGQPRTEEYKKVTANNARLQHRVVVLERELYELRQEIRRLRAEMDHYIP